MAMESELKLTRAQACRGLARLSGKVRLRVRREVRLETSRNAAGESAAKLAPAGRVLRTCPRIRRRERGVVRADGIEPTRPAWKAGVLPLNYAREAQERTDSPSPGCGQACNVVFPHGRKRCATGFSPGFYPVSDCERQVCAVVWNVWHSSLLRQPPRFMLPVRHRRKRPPT
jgi:hypothetical protein